MNVSATESMSGSVTSGVQSSGPSLDLVTSSSSLDLKPASGQAGHGPNTNRMSRIMSKLQILSPISERLLRIPPNTPEPEPNS